LRRAPGSTRVKLGFNFVKKSYIEEANAPPGVSPTTRRFMQSLWWWLHDTPPSGTFRDCPGLVRAAFPDHPWGSVPIADCTGCRGPMQSGFRYS
jgi:hypothetical protein